MIVPHTFTKLTMQNNKLKTEDFEVSGRRIRLTFARKKMLADHKKLMKLRTDQEFKNTTQEEINEFCYATSKEKSTENLQIDGMA